MKSLHKLVLASLATLTMGLMTNCFAANIAVVDVTTFQQQFMNEVNTKLQGQFTSQQQNLQKMADKFKADQLKLQKDANIMSVAQVNELKQSLVNQQNALQAAAKTYEENVLTKRQDELKVKLDDLMRVVSGIANGKYDLVIAKNIALYVDPKFDITQQVVTNYQQAVAAKNANKK
ncbi:MAG: OmpH family outer membrane protein [Gammaproteobacteria bacterium]|nr:OmpH family outer membrane protein [Gammaproteobacteria bacterium]